MSDANDDLRFGPFRLSRHKRQLATDGGVVLLGSRAFDLLVTLIDARGTLLSKHVLLEQVWPGIIVEENNLQVQVATLRRALSPHQALIQTVPGRGYRFAGTVVETAPAFQPEAGVPVEIAAPASWLIGRAAELAELEGLLRRHPVVTVTGPSGIGKTRLATALGREVVAQFPGGIRLVDLAPLGRQSLVAGAVATALGLRRADGVAPEEAIAAALEHRPALLLLDNCEHVVAGVAALIEALLARCASARVLATSQEPLRIEAETVYRLDPLTVPPVGAAEVQGFGAVTLFVRRVEAIDRRFVLGPDNAAAVAEICRRLDGIPLAIEMAAARVPMLGVEGVRARLDERLVVLTAGKRTAEPRHRTLRDTVAWSCDLLDAGDRAVFRRLGIFAGGFSADAAAGVLAEQEADGWDVVDALGRLIDKSLVVAEPGADAGGAAGGRPRYRLLETLRLFAREQLAACGETEALAARHAAWFDRLLARGYDAWEDTDDAAWLGCYAPELDNVRAALDWALEQPGPHAVVLSLAGSSAVLWDRLAFHAEGRRYLERAEAAIDAGTPAGIAARVLHQTGILWHQADRPRAVACLERAAALYASIGDGAGRGAALGLIGSIQTMLGATEAAMAVLLEARALLEPARRAKSLFNVLNNLGVLAALTGDMAAARGMFDAMLVLARRGGSADREAFVLTNLAEIDFIEGAFEQAAERIVPAIAYFRAAQQSVDLGWALVNRGTYLMAAAPAVAEAELVAAEALVLVRQIGGLILRACLQLWALIAACTERVEPAARLLGFVDAAYQAAGEVRQPTEQRVLDRLEERLAAALRPMALLRLRDEGAAWSEQRAVKEGQGLYPHFPVKQAACAKAI